jgi:CHAT domain-containing protein
MGDINFNYKEKSNPSLTKLQNRSYTPKTFSHVINSLNYSPWKNLSGAKEEIHNLQNLFNTPSIDVQFVQGNAATEEVFKGLSGKSPKVIHIATHGFFFKNQYSTQTKEEVSNSPKKVNPFFRDMYLNQYEIALNPLLRSGLILAGGNYAWQYGDNPYEAEDGILTALEISNLDLSNTDLVVLSACETGLGDVESSEGIYGLQRAFKMAGVNSIIMSLWQVPDKETAEFMTNFYENWLSNQSARQAFKTTQLQMAKKYRTEPEKWAGFVYFE